MVEDVNPLLTLDSLLREWKQDAGLLSDSAIYSSRMALANMIPTALAASCKNKMHRGIRHVNSEHSTARTLARRCACHATCMANRIRSGTHTTSLHRTQQTQQTVRESKLKAQYWRTRHSAISGVKANLCLA